MADEAADAAPPTEEAPAPEDGGAEAAGEPAEGGGAAPDGEAGGEAGREEEDPFAAALAGEPVGDEAAPPTENVEPPPEGGEATPEWVRDAEEGAGGNTTEGVAEDKPATEGGEAPPADGETPAEGAAPAEAQAGDEAGAPPGEAGEPVAAEGAEAPSGEDGGAAAAVEPDAVALDSDAAEGGDGEAAEGGKKKKKGKKRGEDEEEEEEEEEGEDDFSGSEGNEEGSFAEDDEFAEGRSDGDEDEDDRPDPILEWKAKEEELLELNEKAMQDNIQLTRRVIQWKMQKDKTTEASEKPSEGKVTEHKYQNRLNEVHTTRMKLRMQQVKAARMNEELIGQLDVKRSMAIECRDSFQNFKQQIARFAEYARTGKRIPEKILREVEEFELDKDAEVEDVRGRQISLKNRLAKLEQQLRKKDELAEDLHVIDFEHLKIENQTLNEKIEVRNEELHKLRKKTIVTVQIITHMREKVQFVSQEFQALKAELGQLDQDLAAQRDLVAKTKHERDDYRSDITKQRQQTGIVNSESLTRDFENRTVHIKQLEEDLTNLKQKYAQLTTYIRRNSPKD